MKRIMTVLAISMAFTATKAQTSKNDWMVGGNFHLNTANKNTQIAFTPNAGLFVTDNLAVGGNLGINYSKSGDNKYTSFLVGPFARYYFTTQDQAVRPIVHGSFNYISTKQKLGTVATSTNTGFNYFIGGGAAMFISKNVSIDALAGYDHTKYKNFDGSGGFAFNIGFQVYLLKDQVDKVMKKK